MNTLPTTTQAEGGPAWTTTTPRIEAALKRWNPELQNRVTRLMARCINVNLRGQDGDDAAEYCMTGLEQAMTHGEVWVGSLEVAAMAEGR